MGISNACSYACVTVKVPNFERSFKLPKYSIYKVGGSSAYRYLNIYCTTELFLADSSFGEECSEPLLPHVLCTPPSHPPTPPATYTPWQS